MDESQYWQAYEKGAAIAAAADVARASALGVGELRTTAHSELIAIRAHLAELRGDPGRRGAFQTRRELAAEIARHERNERRQAMYLEALRQHESAHQSELSRLSPQRDSTTRLLDQLTADFEAMHNAAAREQSK